MSKKYFLLKLLFIFLPLCGLWNIGNVAYMHLKASLAQTLLQVAWSETLETQEQVKAWPWADTWPVGHLSVPKLKIDRIVLAGASGEAMAFGPGRFFIGDNNHATLIAGHRDTHFAFLNELQLGDELQFKDKNTSHLSYEINKRLIVDKEQTHVLANYPDDHLILITCYPFHTVAMRSDLRLLLIAKPKEQIFI